MERRLAAILAADVVGYSRMIRADEDGTLRALQVVLRETGALHIPTHMSYAEGATLPCAGLTAWTMRFRPGSGVQAPCEASGG